MDNYRTTDFTDECGSEMPLNFYITKVSVARCEIPQWQTNAATVRVAALLMKFYF